MAKAVQRAGKALSDCELSTMIRQGDRAAFSVLSERYMPLLSGRAARYAGVYGSDQEDFVQEGLIALYRAAMTFDPAKAKFSTYASTCIDNALTDAVRRMMRASPKNMVLYLDDIGESLLHREASASHAALLPEDAYARGEQSLSRMQQIAYLLSDYEREVLRLYLKGYTYQQISSATSASLKAVDNALQRVRRKLRSSPPTGA